MENNTNNQQIRSHFKASPHQIEFDGGRGFQRMQEAFSLILNAKPKTLSTFHCSFAGHTGLIRVLGPHLAACLLQPFKHLLFDKEGLTTTKLRVDLWDLTETDTPCAVELIDVLFQSTGLYRVICGAPDDRFVICRTSQMITCFDRAAQRIIGCTLDSRRLSIDECVKPINFPLFLWHSDRDSPIVHAGLVSYREKGVLLAGREGAGKSTTAMACVMAGFKYLGDNFVALKKSNNGRVDGYSVYNTLWLEPNQMLHFPFLVAHAIRREAPKWPVLLSHVFPERLDRVAPISAILLPRIQGPPMARVYPASKRDALFALAPSSMVRLPVSGTRSFNQIVQLIDQVPCYWLELGRNLDAVPLRVKQLLRES